MPWQRFLLGALGTLFVGCPDAILVPGNLAIIECAKCAVSDSRSAPLQPERSAARTAGSLRRATRLTLAATRSQRPATHDDANHDDDQDHQQQQVDEVAADRDHE